MHPMVSSMEPVPHRELGPGTADNLKGLFQAAVAELLPGLKAAVQAGDWERVSGLAHRLGGSAAMYSFCEVSAASAAFQAIWTSAKAPNPVKGPAEVVETAGEFVRVCERALGADALRLSEPVSEQRLDGDP